jgi:hypothetical protein
MRALQIGCSVVLEAETVFYVGDERIDDQVAIVQPTFDYATMDKTPLGLSDTLRDHFNDMANTIVQRGIGRGFTREDVIIDMPTLVTDFTSCYCCFKLVLDPRRRAELYRNWNCIDIHETRDVYIGLEDVCSDTTESSLFAKIIAKLPGCIYAAEGTIVIDVPHGTPPVVLNLAMHVRLGHCPCGYCIQMLKVGFWTFGSEVLLTYNNSSLSNHSQSLLRSCNDQLPATTPLLSQVVVGCLSADVHQRRVMDCLHIDAVYFLISNRRRSTDTDHFWPVLYSIIRSTRLTRSRSDPLYDGLEVVVQPAEMAFREGKVRFRWERKMGKRKR